MRRTRRRHPRWTKVRFCGKDLFQDQEFTELSLAITMQKNAAVMTSPLMKWDGVDINEFGKSSLRIQHRAHESGLFDDDELAKLIEQSPRQNYHVETMEPRGDGTFRRREGETGDASGHQALDAVKNGSIWYLLLHPEQVDARYGDLVDKIYQEMADHVPGFRVFSKKISILVSSPNVQVGYHCDVPGQTLWQVRGSKKVYVYPAKPPFLPQTNLERIILKEANEVSLDFDPIFDEHATVYDLQPGEMLHWPLNAPHRVSNNDCLNVSFTTEHTTETTRRSYVVNYANGVLRRTLGLSNLDQRPRGLGYWAKFGVAGAYRMGGFEKRHSAGFAIDFKVDPMKPKGVHDISAYEFKK